MSSKKLKVIILFGLPASGKSTFAKTQLNLRTDYVRVNRDDIRQMIKGGMTDDYKIEELVSDTEKTIIIGALTRNQHVIVDNTHLKMSFINTIIKYANDYADIEFKVFDVDVEECIQRDMDRINPVGEDVIRRMNENFINLKSIFKFEPIPKKRNRDVLVSNFDSMLPPAVCFDIDGTLANMVDRGAFEWDKVGTDSYSRIVGEQMGFHKSLGRTVIVLSGRDSVCRKLTEDWLASHGLLYDMLYMRPENDMRKDSLIKREIYENEIKDKYNLLCVYDDRQQVVNEWYRLGIFCFNVNQGNKVF
jgi:predicted kinase